MSSSPSVTQWAQIVATQLPHLSRPQATVLACWEPGQADRWLLVPDLPPAASTAAWYGLRA